MMRINGPRARQLALTAALSIALVTACDQPTPPGPATKPAKDVNILRSLPYAGFSEEDDGSGDGVLHMDAARSSPGLTLLSVHTQSRAELIDEHGKVMRAWSHSPSRNWDNVELLQNGDLLVVGADPGPAGIAGIVDENRYVLRFDWNGKLLWKRSIPAHHDIERVGADKLLTLTFARRMIPAIHGEVETRDDELTLLNDAGERVESIGLYEPLARQPEKFPLLPNTPMSQGGRSWVDLFHCNAVEWFTRKELADRAPLYSTENVLVTFRHQDRVAIINWPRRELVWAWGQGQLDGPHDAQLLENGNILIFDNGLARGWSRVIELDPLESRIVWEFKAPTPTRFFTKSKGSAQRQPNGNTLICESDVGHVFEVTPAGEIVWDYRTPTKNAAGQRATIFRAKRFARAEIERIAAVAEKAAQPAP